MVTIFFIGLLIAWIIDELTGITPGGYVVPGFLALIFPNWYLIGYVFICSLLILLSLKILDRYMILYSKRRFMACLMLSGIISMGFFILDNMYITYQLQLFGLITPGILAYWCDKQGFWKTQLAAISGLSITRIVIIILIGF